MTFMVRESVYRLVELVQLQCTHTVLRAVYSVKETNIPGNKYRLQPLHAQELLKIVQPCHLAKIICNNYNHWLDQQNVLTSIEYDPECCNWQINSNTGNAGELYIPNSHGIRWERHKSLHFQIQSQNWQCHMYSTTQCMCKVPVYSSTIYTVSNTHTE